MGSQQVNLRYKEKMNKPFRVLRADLEGFYDKDESRVFELGVKTAIRICHAYLKEFAEGEDGFEYGAGIGVDGEQGAWMMARAAKAAGLWEGDIPEENEY